MKDFITIATFTYPNDYAILRLLLEREGISYFFENETMIGVFPFYSNALGGINLKIHSKDKIRVQEIIDDLNSNSHLRII
ncbi:hypothetical protein SAMN04487910_1137 [Aquimarina amphilecti]|uniref:Signal transducing protein n=1 Tax=Aquimarina amphilecti TaxID=1038014 RepID=A0A1H7JXE4_AQUAM|nr:MULTISPECIES: hypothetical protein [Aquimarina]AXT57290.1 DUF2007 domain-containing protein [Aquimarina sp. AD1]MBQ4801467.1 DUF2007 domain-containing protein [Aquimarina sp. MMG015]SEK79371.1 hypothetical protein SAMN04487910_1137 [Aquimarina amphilecti]